MMYPRTMQSELGRAAFAFVTNSVLLFPLHTQHQLQKQRKIHDAVRIVWWEGFREFLVACRPHVKAAATAATSANQTIFNFNLRK